MRHSGKGIVVPHDCSASAVTARHSDLTRQLPLRIARAFTQKRDHSRQRWIGLARAMGFFRLRLAIQKGAPHRPRRRPRLRVARGEGVELVSYRRAEVPFQHAGAPSSELGFEDAPQPREPEPTERPRPFDVLDVEPVEERLTLMPSFVNRGSENSSAKRDACHDLTLAGGPVTITTLVTTPTIRARRETTSVVP